MKGEKAAPRSVTRGLAAFMNDSVLNTDFFDRRRFNQLFEMSEKMQDVEKSHRDTLPSLKPLMSDMWASLFKMKPEPKDEVEGDLQANRQLIERVMQDDAHKKFREFSKLDDLTSAIGAMRYSETVLEWLQEQKEQNDDLSDAMEQAQGGNKEAMEQVAQLIQNELEQSGNQLSAMLQQASDSTNQTKDDLKSLLGGIEAGKGEAELKKVPLRDQLEFAEKLERLPNLKQIAEWAGRFKHIAQKKQRSKYDKSIDRSGITLGNEVEKLLPSELAAFKHPSTRNDFLRRFAEGQTMMFDSRGKEELGKGPIILCLDQSGSMEDQDAVSKGFALALMGIARRQRRNFALILFSSGANNALIYERGKISIPDLMNLATTFLGGGTEFMWPLNESLKVINKSRFKKADIIFLTDGEDRLDDEYIRHFNVIKKEKEFKVLSLLLGSERGSTVAKFSDRIVKASSFSDDAIHEAFEI